jgi:hypothetical protein
MVLPAVAAGGGIVPSEAAAGGGMSWFAQRVQLKVSPTYADPKDGGRLRMGLRTKGDGFVGGVLLLVVPLGL